MNVYYAKSVLYAYPHIEQITEQIDELVERKALSSMTDYSPCEEIANKIIEFTEQKQTFIELHVIVSKALRRLTEDELDCLDYKYFKQKPKEYYKDFDASSRAYFRKQVRVAKKFAKLMENRGATDGWFEKYCMCMDFFKEMYKRVIEHEINSMKNKPKNKKRLTEKLNTIPKEYKKDLIA